MKTSLLTASAFALLVLTAQASDLAKCPLIVQDAIRANIGAGKLDDVDTITRDGIVEYVAKVDMPHGHDMKIYIANDGSFIQSRQEIRLSEAPVLVQASFKQLSSSGNGVEQVDRIVAPGGVSYVAKINTPKGPDQRIAVTEDGAVLGPVEKR